MKVGWFAVLVGGFSGCSVGVSMDNQAETSAIIPCDASNPCDSGMVCVSNQCRVSELTISHVLADISLPASTNAGQYSGMSFVLPLDVPTLGNSDIVLPALGQLTLDAKFPEITVSGNACDYSQSSADVRVEATHRWSVDGLEHAVFVANTLPTQLSAIPVGVNYELYVALKSQDSACPLPPVLVRDVMVSANQSLTLTWPSPTSIALDVQIQTSNVSMSNDPLYSWQLDIVDPVQGHILANPVTLDHGESDASSANSLHYHTKLTYNPIVSAGSNPPLGTELIRLQPPQATGTSPYPTYYESISSLKLFAGSTELPVPINAVPSPVRISGRVESADLAQALPSSISFTSTGFNVSNSGIIATYSAAVASQDDGTFVVDLPAGQYHVVVVPPSDSKYGVLNTDWSIQPNPSEQAGRLLQVPGYSEIDGTIDTSLVLSGSQSATIAATPTMGLIQDTVSQIVAARNLSPGARAASLLFQPQSKSDFSLAIDTGEFDVSLRPPDGLPWLVSPWHTVLSGGNTLPNWSMPIPVSWSGKLLVPAKDPTASPNSLALPRTAIRIYALVSTLEDGTRLAVDSPKDAKAIVQIAECRTQADGSFQFELPDRFGP
jgi:hypothetical protein